jgi:hypothetical protein
MRRRREGPRFRVARGTRKHLIPLIELGVRLDRAAAKHADNGGGPVMRAFAPSAPLTLRKP